jgi:hypothetical protein
MSSEEIHDKPNFAFLGNKNIVRQDSLPLLYFYNTKTKYFAMSRRYGYYLIISAIGIIVIYYFYSTELNKPKFGLEVDPTKDITDIAGIQYRVRISNIGTKPLTGIVVGLGKGDVQNLSVLEPGQSYYFYPKPDTLVSGVKVITNEGIRMNTDYRSPTKVIGLPGAGR